MSWILAAMAYLFIVYFVSGQVFKGTWNRTKVALKVLMMEDGVTPSSMVCQEQQFTLIPLVLTLNFAVDP